jgi:mycothiol system anti-sigma-R factor
MSTHGHDHPSAAEEADCVDFLDRIVRLIDNELQEGDCAIVRAHIDSCNPCLERYNLQRTVKALVARSCSEQAPAELRERVRIQISQIKVQITES